MSDRRFEVSFPLEGDWLARQEQIVEIVQRFGGRTGDSGAGLGYRDMEFVFPDPERTEGAKEAIKGLNIQGLTI